MSTEATKEHQAHKSTYSVLENSVQVPCFGKLFSYKHQTSVLNRSCHVLIRCNFNIGILCESKLLGLEQCVWQVPVDAVLGRVRKQNQGAQRKTSDKF